MNPRKLNDLHPHPYGLLGAMAELLFAIVFGIPMLLAWLLLMLGPWIAIAWLIVMLCRK